jgi:hypothetical protein
MLFAGGPMSARLMLRALSIFAAFLVDGAALAAQGRADDGPTILRNMSYLKPLVGTWNAVAEYHQKDGSVAYDVGTYKISYVLEGTYLEWDVELHDKDDPSQHHGFLNFVTYSPVTGRYDSTYFYSLWSLRVSEIGKYDDKAKEFTTEGFIPVEDGVHDENVRTVTKIGDSNKIIHEHYSRYSNETTPRLDLVITLTRVQ